MEQTQQTQTKLPFTPEEAKLLARYVRARIEWRRKKRDNEQRRRALQSVFSLGFFRAPNGHNSADEMREVWEDVGDEMRLVMLDIAANQGK